MLVHPLKHSNNSMLVILLVTKYNDNVMMLWRRIVHGFFFSCLKWMASCIAILSTILRYHVNTAISCAPVLFTAIGNILFTIIPISHWSIMYSPLTMNVQLLVNIIEVAQSREDDELVDEIVTVANNLCRWAGNCCCCCCCLNNY